MVFVAGEEISWGQRIFGFATPDFLIRLNNQKEFTVHNIANGTFNIIWLNGTLVLCMVTSVAFFFRKDRVFGIPLRSIPLMLGFLIIISYASGANFMGHSGRGLSGFLSLVRTSLGFIVIDEKGLLILFLIFALFSGHVKLIIVSSATLALVLALTYVNYRSDVNVGSLFEVREYLFGIGCLYLLLGDIAGSGTVRGNPAGAVPRPGTAGRTDSILNDDPLSGNRGRYRGDVFSGISTHDWSCRGIPVNRGRQAGCGAAEPTDVHRYAYGPGSGTRAARRSISSA